MYTNGCTQLEWRSHLNPEAEKFAKNIQQHSIDVFNPPHSKRLTEQVFLQQPLVASLWVHRASLYRGTEEKQARNGGPYLNPEAQENTQNAFNSYLQGTTFNEVDWLNFSAITSSSSLTSGLSPILYLPPNESHGIDKEPATVRVLPKPRSPEKKPQNTFYCKTHSTFW